MENALCFNASAQFLAYAGYIITAASVVANLLPAPDETGSKALRIISRVVHFFAVDIVTSVKK